MMTSKSQKPTRMKNLGFKLRNIWYIFYKLVNQETANIVLSFIGITALVLRPYLINAIVKTYQKRKYTTLEGFKQQEN